MIPKGFPHHPNHFFCQNWTNYTPIWAHFVACMMEFSCILAIPCSENSVFLERKKIDPKRHPKTCKRLPTSSKCRNALFLIIFSRRFTHVSLGSSHTHAYFGWASTWICMGPDLEIIFGGQKSEIFSIFLLLHKLVRKGFPRHLHHFFRRKSINFTPIGAHFEACIVSFRCVCIRRARLIVICISFLGSVFKFTFIQISSGWG